MNSKQRILFVFVTMGSILIIINFPKVSLAIMIMMNDPDYKKSNYHYSSGESDQFSVWSRKGYDDVIRQFEVYKNENQCDAILYRNFEPNWWKVWRWYFYLSEMRYRLPYKEMPMDAFEVSRGIND